MPSCLVRDLQSGEGVTHTGGTASSHLHGLQVRNAHQEDAEEAGGVWTVEDGVPALLEDFDRLEHMLVAEVADAEAMEPRTLAEAKCRPDWPLWEKAIKEKLATLKAAGTWRLEEAPPGANIISFKWVFKAKKDAAGNIVRYKAWLVAQGFSQIGSVNYDNTYAPVTRLASLCAIIMMANCLHLDLHQVDIKGAYLNSVLNDNEVLYMQHSPGYKAPDAGMQVLRLIKTLCSLKQSGRQWYQKLTSIFTSLGFKQCSVNKAIFFKVNVCKGKLTITAVHVDDCTIAATCICLIEELKASLRQHVKVMDLGELHWMLSIEIKHDRKASTIHLSQHVYIDAILCCYNFADLKPLPTPMDVQVHLSSKQAPASVAECAIMCDVPYHKAVSALNWAALSMHPDITFAVATMACFTSNPGPVHWEAIKQIFHYLAGTRDLWLSYGESKHTLEGYTNADGSMAKDRCAITGYTFLIDGGAVSWSSKWQEIISLSTIESKYIAATHSGKEVLWLHSLISEVFGTLQELTTLFSDNQAAIALTCDHQYHT
jgi:Reverse transcriptase (RNA-dependent DNA polymerase)